MKRVNFQGGKHPEWKVLDSGASTENSKRSVKLRGYAYVSPNYKGKNPMRITQWRRYPINQKVIKEGSTSNPKAFDTLPRKNILLGS